MDNGLNSPQSVHDALMKNTHTYTRLNVHCVYNLNNFWIVSSHNLAAVTIFQDETPFHSVPSYVLVVNLSIFTGKPYRPKYMRYKRPFLSIKLRLFFSTINMFGCSNEPTH